MAEGNRVVAEQGEPIGVIQYTLEGEEVLVVPEAEKIGELEAPPPMSSAQRHLEGIPRGFH